MADLEPEQFAEYERPSWEGLTPPYGAVVVDPPWQYEVISADGTRRRVGGGPSGVAGWRMPYSQMSLDAIKALPVGQLVIDGRCFLWTTNRYLRHSWAVLEAWGFAPQERVLVWCKTPRGGGVTTEFVLIGRKGKPPRMPFHSGTWFPWGQRESHSAKPQAFMDLVESWCPGPYVELFARMPRLGWHSWGKGYEVAS